MTEITWLDRQTASLNIPADYPESGGTFTEGRVTRWVTRAELQAEIDAARAKIARLEPRMEGASGDGGGDQVISVYLPLADAERESGMTDAEKLGRIKARVAMIQEERGKPKRSRVVGLIGSCLRDIENLLSGVEAIYAIKGGEMPDPLETAG